MNRKTRIALLLTGALTLTGVSAGVALADGDGSGCRAGMMRSAWGGDFKGRADAKLEKLHSELKLRPDQEAAFTEYRQAVTAQAGRMQERMKSARESERPATAIERLERFQAGMDEGRTALGKLTDSTKRFYAVLDKEQQKRFDDVASRFGPGRFGGGHRHGHGHGGEGRGSGPQDNAKGAV